MSAKGRQRRATPATRTPSAASSISSMPRSSSSGRSISSQFIQPRSTPPIFSSPAPPSRQEQIPPLASPVFSPHASVRSSPSLPPHPQPSAGRLPLPVHSAATPSTVQTDGYGRNGESRCSDFPGSDEPDTMNEVIMAIDMKDNGTVGCAYYVAIDEALFLQEDIQLAGIELVETLLLHAEPTTVLISIRSPDSLVRFIEAGAQDFQGNRNQEEG